MSTPTVNEVFDTFMDAEVDNTEWDLPPRLLFVTEGDNDPEKFSVIVMFFEGQHPADALNWIAEASDAGGPPVPERIVGIGVITEAWTIAGKSKEEMREALEWMQSGRSLADHPQGVESKTLSSYDGYEHVLRSYQRGNEKRDENMVGGDGRVPDALKRAFDAINARFDQANS